MLPDSSGVEWVDPSASVSLVERSVSGAWAGKTIADLEEGGGIRVAALSRLGTSQVPTPGLVVKDGDIVYVSVSGAALSQLDSRLAKPVHEKGWH